jgi:hypothetical protein
MKIALAIAAMALLPVQPINRSCGLEPIPPRGCQVNTCVCDNLGSNCHWLFFCGFCCGYNSKIQPFYPYFPNYGNALDTFRTGGVKYQRRMLAPPPLNGRIK